jgi:hypothetical protein
MPSESIRCKAPAALRSFSVAVPMEWMVITPRTLYLADRVCQTRQAELTFKWKMGQNTDSCLRFAREQAAPAGCSLCVVTEDHPLTVSLRDSLCGRERLSRQVVYLQPKPG